MLKDHDDAPPFWADPKATLPKELRNKAMIEWVKSRQYPLNFSSSYCYDITNPIHIPDHGEQAAADAQEEMAYSDLFGLDEGKHARGDPNPQAVYLVP